MRVRNSAKALIIEDGRVLCIQKQDRLGYYALLPGGGQEPGETLHEALRRECREEIGAEVEIGALRFIREYISSHHEFAGEEEEAHQVDLMFLCSLTPGSEAGVGSMPDIGQLAVVWVPLEDLVAARLYPVSLSRALATGEWDDVPVYLGDVN